MKNILVAVPHDIHIIEGSTFNPALRKWVGGDHVKTLAKSGIVLSAKIVTEPVMQDPAEIPIFSKKITGFDSIPMEHNDCDIVIVSALYASAAISMGSSDIHRLYTVADPVYTEDGNSFLGCRGICLAF